MGAGERNFPRGESWKLETYREHDVLMGRIDFGGVFKRACLEHVPEAQPGDYVLVHVGFALSLVDPEEAERTYRLLQELGLLGELQAPETEA